MAKTSLEVHQMLAATLGNAEGALGGASSSVEAFERMLIDNTMRRHKGSIVAVMEELCLPRRTLNEKMAKYNLQRQDYV